MKKFTNDVAEVGRDIKHGFWCAFKAVVLFCWTTGVIAEEHGGNLIKYIGKYRNKRTYLVTIPASEEVVNNVVFED